ncbi:hypothetical protein [Streptomyces sp. NPDC085479]|uniref:hypothetical protein n=1 Tax=Streptomyces sp. NPDC085479 TaxID=3365726 RepID=UPI0037D3B663
MLLGMGDAVVGGAELAALVVGALTATVTGVATGLGEGAGIVVADSVRARLAGTERGRTALERLEADPADPGVREEAVTVVREEIEADPEWARRLQVHIQASSSQPTGSVLIQDSRISRSHISLGPLTVNNTPGGRVVLTAVLVALLVLVSLGAYGTVQLFASDDSPRAASPAPGGGVSSGPSVEGPASGTADPSKDSVDLLPAPTLDLAKAEITRREAKEVLPTQDEVLAGLRVFQNAKADEDASSCTKGSVSYELVTRSC